MDKISIIIPTRNEEKYLRKCLGSIVEGFNPNINSEIFVVDGRSNDETIKIVKEFTRKYDNIYLINNDKQTTPFAINSGIKKSSGDFIFIISAHAEYPPDYFTILVARAKELKADCVGGVLKTETLDNTQKSKAIQFVLSNKWGVGNALFRTGVNKVYEVDTVAFGCYRKSVFEKYGFFNTKLTRNQDIEFNLRIKNGGGKIYLVPDVTATYFARNNFSDFAKNSFKNGLWNILTIFYTRDFSALSIRHFVPLAFVLSIIIPLILSIFHFPFLYFSFLILLIYLSLITIVSIKFILKKVNLFNILASFLILHFSYGIGSLFGVLKTIVLFFLKQKK